jgi:hypothetical protein
LQEAHKVDDLTAIQPFEGAINRTATLIAGLSKRANKYPISYIVWNISVRLSDIKGQLVKIIGQIDILVIWRDDLL